MNQKQQLCAPGVPLSVARDLMLATVAIILFSAGFAQAQAGRYTKAVVSDHIRKVEDGVDEFRDYLEKRGENARDQAQSGQSSGTRTRRGGASSGNTEARKEQAGRTKDELDDALGDLNRSTNRLRRKFDPTSNYMETRAQMENVMESARRVNQVMVRGKYGTQPERYWAALRAAINDLARCYGVTPLGV